MFSREILDALHHANEEACGRRTGASDGITKFQNKTVKIIVSYVISNNNVLN